MQKKVERESAAPPKPRRNSLDNRTPMVHDISMLNGGCMRKGIDAREWFYAQSFISSANDEARMIGNSDPYPEREWCPVCGWKKGGKDSWDGVTCKCGHRLPEAKDAQ